MSDVIKYEEIQDKLDFMRQMYDVVRFVDPVDKLILDESNALAAGDKDLCYACWNRGTICENCISIRTYLNNKCYQKLEQTDDGLMIVTAFPIERDGTPVVMELVKDVTDTMMFGDVEDFQLVDNLVSRLTTMAVRDELTGVFNRRYINERLPSDIVMAMLDDYPVSLLFVDIDNLKEINDTYGHFTGDTVIVSSAAAIQSCLLSKLDWVARFGGDEFVVCLNGAAPAEVIEVAENIREKIFHLCVEDNDTIRFSASVGVSITQGNTTAAELLTLADARMYEAKKKGKNRIVTYDGAELV